MLRRGLLQRCGSAVFVIWCGLWHQINNFFARFASTDHLKCCTKKYLRLQWNKKKSFIFLCGLFLVKLQRHDANEKERNLGQMQLLLHFSCSFLFLLPFWLKRKLKRKVIAIIIGEVSVNSLGWLKMNRKTLRSRQSCSLRSEPFSSWKSMRRYVMQWWQSDSIPHHLSQKMRWSRNTQKKERSSWTFLFITAFCNG